jgi:metal-responsive CopG/Arc/MetJ family transcriptional regulator
MGYERIQVLLEPTQRRELEQFAHDTNRSLSAIIRDLVQATLQEQRKIEMRKAAETLLDDYRTDRELTAFVALDGEDVHA